MKKLLLGLLLGLGLTACPGEDEGPCRTNADCALAPANLCDQTLALSCVSGECVELCETDADCREDPLESTDRRECGGVNPNRFRVCADRRCAAGCVPPGMNGEGLACGAGETCAADGRCALFAESFEPPAGETSISLPVLREVCRTEGTDPSSCSKWDDLPRAKRNTASRVSFAGLPNCNREAIGAEDVCAGPAAQGSFFLRLQRVPIASRSALFDFTCAACKCCSDCLDGTLRLDSEPTCLGVSIPEIPRMCVNPSEPACASVCADCSQCPAVPPGEDQRPTTEEETGLNQCQVVAAARICPAWLDSESCRLAARAAACQSVCPNPEETPAPCDQCLRSECADEERTYRACELAQTERLACPGCTDIWGPLQDLCDTQGPMACVQGPVLVNRGNLKESEQAVVSPILNLQGVTGDLRLTFQYIPFKVGPSFYLYSSNDPEDLLDPTNAEGVYPQEVRVQFCGGGCESESNWVASGRLLPTVAERNNGLQPGLHAAGDWAVYGFDVSIPDALRTSGFRFRFLPRLADDAVLGVDNVIVRRFE